jgi:hypothetical protein
VFGEFYHQFDRLLSAQDPRCDIERYAAELLAELLNRAKVLESAWTVVYEYRDTKDPEYVVRLEALARAVDLFGDDVDEAILRGRRARLFGLTIHGKVSPDLSESKESLDEIGGELLPD